MKLILNEQEIIDGICVYVAHKYGTQPETVDVKELTYNRDELFTATVESPYAHEDLNSVQITYGIVRFLSEYHNFNPDIMSIEMDHSRKHGFTAIVNVGEGEEQ